MCTVQERRVSVILLARGKVSMLKQYLPLLSQPIALCRCKHKIQTELKFTLPGKERQDSVYSGLQALKDGWLIDAAVLGVPVKATIKEANSESFVAIKPELLKKGFELVNRGLK
ncbi:hypothetical protein ACLB2K_050402 [Fragaria x ananassa]